MVLHGDAGAALLDTYAAERKPVAEMTVARQLANYVERLRPDRAEVARHVLESSGQVPDYMSVAFGYRYRSAGDPHRVAGRRRACREPLRADG